MPESLDATLVRQEWEAYTDAQHAVWGTLYARRMPALYRTASRVFLDGAEAIGLESEFIPELAVLNRRLSARTGWSAVPVSGFLPAGGFFRPPPGRACPTPRLPARTGWPAGRVSAFLPAGEFFRSLARGQFPPPVTIRPADR